jgi:2-hydroxy-3-oxopropionate reductase
MTKIAFLGIGLMGAPMSRRLLRAGFPVTVWNRTKAKAEAIAADGAAVASTPAEAVANADVIVTMLDSGPVVTDVLFAQGAADAAREGATVIDMSSIPPLTAKDHHARLAKRGVRHLDAPVSGGTVGAEQGTLAIMAGGDRAAFEEMRPVFDAMGRATYVGAPGSGQLAKLANQAIVAINIAAVAEALILAEKGGADPAAVREAIRGGFAESRILEVHGERMLKRDFAPRGRVNTHIKDMRTILATAADLGIDLPFSREAHDRFVDLRDRLGGGDLDHSAMFLQLEAPSAKT